MESYQWKLVGENARLRCTMLMDCEREGHLELNRHPRPEKERRMFFLCITAAKVRRSGAWSVLVVELSAVANNKISRRSLAFPKLKDFAELNPPIKAGPAKMLIEICHKLEK